MSDTTQQLAEQMPAGSRITSETGTWTAGAPTDPTRWLHEGGERQVSDATVQRWLGSGKAQVPA